MNMTLQISGQQNGLALDSLATDCGRLVSSVCRRMIRNEDRARDEAQLHITDLVHNGEVKVKGKKEATG